MNVVDRQSDSKAEKVPSRSPVQDIVINKHVIIGSIVYTVMSKKDYWHEALLDACLNLLSAVA